MAYCTHCGRSQEDVAHFCANCGSPMPGAPPLTANPIPRVGLASAPSRNAGLAQMLVLAGAIIQAAFALVLALVLSSFGRGPFADNAFSWFGPVPFAAFTLGLLWFWVLLWLVWAALAFVAWRLLARGQVDRGALMAVIAGALMLFTGAFFAGLLVLGGAVVAWVVAARPSV